MAYDYDPEKAHEYYLKYRKKGLKKGRKKSAKKTTAKKATVRKKAATKKAVAKTTAKKKTAATKKATTAVTISAKELERLNKAIDELDARIASMSAEEKVVVKDELAEFIESLKAYKGGK